MKKVVIDTNAYSGLMKGDKRVEQALNKAKTVYLPIFVVAELLSGFKNGNKEEENRSILTRFEAISTVNRYFPTNETIEIFTEIFSDLKKAGKPIPTHDIWIAAIAIETGSEIITYDRHFNEIVKARVWKG